MIVYIKYGLLLKDITNQRFAQPFLLEEYKPKILFFSLATANN